MIHNKIHLIRPGYPRPKVAYSAESWPETLFISFISVSILPARFLDEMMQAVSENENAKVLTVYYKVARVDLPDHLKVHECLDYDDRDFKTDLVAAITGMSEHLE